MFFRTLLVVASVTASFTAAGAPADAADPNAAAPSSRYESVFSRYRRYQEPKPVSWREQNDEMGRLGGHAGQLRQDHRGAPASSEGAPPASSGHAGHH